MEEHRDPFDVRLEFLELVRKLTASQTSIMTACSFAIRHRELHEILYDCLWDQLKEVYFSSLLSHVVSL